ncbi:unnamed protein product, partial [Coregonus sp. 'balchen']
MQWHPHLTSAKRTMPRNSPYLPESEDDVFINIKFSAIHQAFEHILRGQTLPEGDRKEPDKRAASFSRKKHMVGFYYIFYESIVQEHIPAILKPTLHTPWISEGTKKTRPDGLYHPQLYEVFNYTDPKIILDRKRYESLESLAAKDLSDWKRLFCLLQSYLDEN